LEREGVHVRARIAGDALVVEECVVERTCRLMEAHGSLVGGVLDPLEAAYQAARGRLEVGGVAGWLAALTIVEELVGDFDLFIVYYDLRRRGRRVRRGVRPRTLVVEYTQARRAEVLVLSEGARVPLSRIVEWSELAAADDRDPVIAVVDSYGRATYYEARASRSVG